VSFLAALLGHLAWMDGSKRERRESKMETDWAAESETLPKKAKLETHARNISIMWGSHESMTCGVNGIYLTLDLSMV
jgi:hypothetical protein